MKLNNGDVIIFPTDTVYGMGARINDYEALENIYKINDSDMRKRLKNVVLNIPRHSGKNFCKFRKLVLLGIFGDTI